MNMNERTIQNGVCRVQMTGICKSFGGINALNDVSLELRAGEIHALMGENGAGKSTLMRIMSGVYQADAGEIMIEGEKKQMLSPKDGIDNGMAGVFLNAAFDSCGKYPDRLAEHRKENRKLERILPEGPGNSVSARLLKY